MQQDLDFFLFKNSLSITDGSQVIDLGDFSFLDDLNLKTKDLGTEELSFVELLADEFSGVSVSTHSVQII